ncbi:MAG: hypothetical protein LUF77_03025 [Oscillospiraceae bacterium]|nr:hypothetical protein [Oscillospiraceae bacterium]MCD7934279.1 hypothetical protein [Oscillospiraceae bacterium]
MLYPAENPLNAQQGKTGDDTAQIRLRRLTANFRRKSLQKRKGTLRFCALFWRTVFCQMRLLGYAVMFRKKLFAFHGLFCYTILRCFIIYIL